MIQIFFHCPGEKGTFISKNSYNPVKNFFGLFQMIFGGYGKVSEILCNRKVTLYYSKQFATREEFSVFFTTIISFFRRNL